MYKSAYVLGKFLPPTKGHMFLIDTALKNSEKVTLLVCSLKNEPIPGDYRYNWIKEIYKDEKKLTIINFKEEVPQNPEEHIDFWNIWVDIAKRNCPEDIDVIFTSEEYGNPYSKKLGIKHHLVDIERKNFPVSGTKVRNNSFDFWNFIPDVVKPFFVKRIAIMGPESVGKSTMSKSLASYFNTNFVIEYGRTVYESKNNQISISDFIPISEGRQSLEDWAIKKSNKIIFCDTEDITTYIFSKMFYPNEYSKIEEYFKNKIESSPKYDLYLLLNPDCESIQDGTRVFLNERLDHFNEIKKTLIDNKCNYIEIIGSNWNDRVNQSINIIKSIYKL